jgi:putative oxidoreductase
MKVTALVARILFGLIMVVSGVSGFFIFNNPPPGPPGLATDFTHVFFQSRWVLFVDGIQFIAGALLLVNRFVPLALLMLAAMIFNMFVYHITMMPIGIFGPLVLLVLWIIVALQHRTVLAPLLDPNA